MPNFNNPYKRLKQTHQTEMASARTQARPTNLCYFYQNGFCRFGNSCLFRHPNLEKKTANLCEIIEFKKEMEDTIDSNCDYCKQSIFVENKKNVCVMYDCEHFFCKTCALVWNEKKAKTFECPICHKVTEYFFSNTKIKSAGKKKQSLEESKKTLNSITCRNFEQKFFCSLADQCPFSHRSKDPFRYCYEWSRGLDRTPKYKPQESEDALNDSKNAQVLGSLGSLNISTKSVKRSKSDVQTLERNLKVVEEDVTLAGSFLFSETFDRRVGIGAMNPENNKDPLVLPPARGFSDWLVRKQALRNTSDDEIEENGDGRYGGSPAIDFNHCATIADAGSDRSTRLFNFGKLKKRPLIRFVEEVERESERKRSSSPEEIKTTLDNTFERHTRGFGSKMLLKMIHL